MPLIDLIQEATAFLKGKVRHTPVELSEKLGTQVWLKLESLQTTGSVKLRGAWFRLSRLTEDEKRTGIATCSAGNHGKAIAFAARQIGTQATIYVPSSVDESKFRGMKALGAEVVVSKFPGYDDTQEWALAEAAKKNRPFISAFDDPAIIAGNGGSLGVEVLDDLPAARTFILPVGGGGLAAGFAVYAKEKYANAVIIGCQHELSPALRLSLDKGIAVTRLPAADTVAGGVEGGIGKQPFDLLRSRIDGVALVSEAEIFAAVRWMLETHQYLIEPSAAVTVAACLTGKAGKITSPAVVVLSGRNVSMAVLKRILG